MKRIAFFQYDLGMGGIQKSLRNLLLNLDYSDLEVDLYLFSHENFWEEKDFANQFFPGQVSVHYINPGPKSLKYVPFDIALSQLTVQLQNDFPSGIYYDAAIDFNSYQPECAAGAILVPAARRIEWVHNDIRIKLQNEWKYRVLHRFFRGKFKYFDEFVCVSRGIQEPFISCNGKYFGRNAKVSVIQNYIDTTEIEQKRIEPVQEFSINPAFFNLVTIGRLCHQKGYDIMLTKLREAIDLRHPLTEAHPDQYPPLRLYFIGDGPDHEKLFQHAKKLQLMDTDNPSVVFLGRKSNPFNIMNKMDAFISTSRYEGQAMNIMEAKAIGLPLFCTKNLEAYVDGLVGCPDIAQSLAHAEKKPLSPDSLSLYNYKIVSSVLNLTKV